jgi:hypothetical protein
MLGLLIKKLIEKMRRQRDAVGAGEVGVPLAPIEDQVLDPLFGAGQGPIGGGRMPGEGIRRRPLDEGGSAAEKAATGYQVARALGGDWTAGVSLLVKAGKKVKANKEKYPDMTVMERRAAIKKAKKDAKKASTGGAKDWVDAETDLSSPWIIDPEARDPVRTGMQIGGPIDEQMGELMPEEAPLIEEMAEEPLEIPQEARETQLPDEEMEGNYLDFVISEALVPEEEQYLLDKLSEDDLLSEIFDKVVETASEFSGAGSVEGPGDAVSDSIPARLSDGEFVMTSKASNQIGPEVLTELMALAEEEADVEPRQTAEAGGLAQTEGSAILAGVSEDERGLAMKNKEAMRLLDPRLSLFAS